MPQSVSSGTMVHASAEQDTTVLVGGCIASSAGRVRAWSAGASHLRLDAPRRGPAGRARRLVEWRVVPPVAAKARARVSAPSLSGITNGSRGVRREVAAGRGWNDAVRPYTPRAPRAHRGRRPAVRARAAGALGTLAR